MQRQQHLSIRLAQRAITEDVESKESGLSIDYRLGKRIANRSKSMQGMMLERAWCRVACLLPRRLLT